MKNSTFTLLVASALVFCSVISSFAGTFYVCDGTTFTLKASSTTFAQYKWEEGTNTLTGSGTNGSELALKIDLSDAKVAQTKTYKLSVHNGTCWSNAETHTVYVLPKPVVAITDPMAYCPNEGLAGILTAEPEAYTGLAAALKPKYTYSWTGGTSTTDKLAITAVGSYSVTIAYDFTDLEKTGVKATCTGSITHEVILATPPTAPSVTIE